MLNPICFYFELKHNFPHFFFLFNAKINIFLFYSLFLPHVNKKKTLAAISRGRWKNKPGITPKRRGAKILKKQERAAAEAKNIKKKYQLPYLDDSSYENSIKM